MRIRSVSSSAAASGRRGRCGPSGLPGKIPGRAEGPKEAAIKGKKTDLDRKVAEESSANVAAAENDDQLYFTIQNLDVWRYPISGETAEDEEGNAGQAWYQIVVPISTDAPTNASICGVNLEWYQPIHENGNLLSYPASIARIADHPDGAAGDLTTALTFDTGYNTLSTGWDWKNTQFSERGETLTGSLSKSLTFGVGTHRKQGDPTGWDASVGVTGDGAYSHAVTTQTSFSDSTGLKVLKPSTTDLPLAGPIPWNHLVYGVTAQVFQAEKGYMTVGFAPNLRASGAGDFWTGKDSDYAMPYYEKPDPALNLPRKYVSIPFKDEYGFTRKKWTLNSASASHDIRGIYFTTESGDLGEVLPESSSNNVGVDLPKGEKLYVQCRIYNYSFLPVSDVKVRFYYAPYNPRPGHQSEGTAVEIGTTSIAKIPAWTSSGSPNWAWAKILWDTSNIPLPSSTDNYMVRVRIDPDNEIDEVHDDGDPAENNTGRYEVALTDSADLEPAVDATGIRTSVLIASCDLAVSAGSLSVSKDVVSADEPITVNASVLLTDAAKKRARVLVGFFDGKPGAGGKLFDLRRIPLVSPDVPYAVQATFRSSTTGRHTLYAKVLGEPGNRNTEAPSIPVVVSDGGGGSGGGCDAAGPGAAGLGLSVLLSFLARRKK